MTSRDQHEVSAIPAPASRSQPGNGGEPHGYTADREALLRRLHRIGGQVKGIERMVADDRYCVDILTQIAAATSALESVALRILDEHVDHCIAAALASGDASLAQEGRRELVAAVERFTRTR